MATVIKITQGQSGKKPLHTESLKKYDTPGRNPDKAVDAMYGLWEGKNITIESIRVNKRRKKW
jgi:hypothetical protein